MRSKALIKYIAFILFLTVTTGCEEKKPGQAAPLNDVSTLQGLADVYNDISSQYPTNPVNLAPKMRKKFVEQVFIKAGYSYSETLNRLSEVDSASITKLHRDMQELLFLPHYQLQEDAFTEIYSKSELAAVKIIIHKFN